MGNGQMRGEGRKSRVPSCRPHWPGEGSDDQVSAGWWEPRGIWELAKQVPFSLGGQGGCSSESTVESAWRGGLDAGSGINR